MIGQEHREAEHLNKLKDIKDYQLVELGKLELMMVEKSNTSRAAYDAKRQQLYSRESRSRLGTKTNRERKPSQLSTSLHIY